MLGSRTVTAGRPRNRSAIRSGLACIGLLAFSCAHAVETARLSAGACLGGNLLAADDFESVPAFRADASHGSGGVAGKGSATVQVSGLPTGTYYWHVPAAYDGTQPWPIVIALHGTAGSHASALLAAAQLRIDWVSTANANRLLVFAPASSGTQGGWLPPDDADDHASDYDLIAAALLDFEARFNVDRSRRYLWGFSSGGHVAHDLMLNNFNPVLNGNTVAGYAVQAGILAALTCAQMTAAQCAELLDTTPRKPPVQIRIGALDPLLSHTQSDRDLMLAHGWQSGTNHGYLEGAGGHTYDYTLFPALWQSMCRDALASP